ncbi:MAG: MBL fold metallo-hydrolase [candidate division WS1 bacterium]|jgi:glyoxylase-like metal-dependent hydrolase (beta-lactamase superfamily II)|nr:MBL fold metallo-hydrolase [candidate division WS1 bacterium]
MILETLPVGALDANCYIAGCPKTREGFIVDPGGDADTILDALRRLELTIRYIFNTHGHVDHVGANAALHEATGASLVVHGADREALVNPHPYWAAMVGGVEPSQPDETMADGDVYEVGTLSLRVLHTPGHSPGCVCLLMDEVIFTGDTLFAGSVGRTDLPGGSIAELEASLRRLVEEVPPATRVLPGHGPATTMADEAANNPFLRNL